MNAFYIVSKCEQEHVADCASIFISFGMHHLSKLIPDQSSH